MNRRNLMAALAGAASLGSIQRATAGLPETASAAQALPTANDVFRSPLILRTPNGRIREAREGAYVGDKVLCESGHVVGRCVKRLETGAGANTWGDAFEIIGGNPLRGTEANKCICRKCGGRWLYAALRKTG